MLTSGPRKCIRPPSGFEDHLSRRDAALLLGFASEFKVRQLEKAGRLHAVRGVMGSAWYPRAEVAALRRAPAPPLDAAGGAPGPGRWSDAALIAHLRGWVESEGQAPRARTIVDLVADTGIPISRAERLYRFWLAHDLHPAALAARAAKEEEAKAPPAKAAPAPAAKTSAERRSGQRLERDALLRQLRHPDPKLRAEAFEKLKRSRSG